jgi:hypothetical protein
MATKGFGLLELLKDRITRLPMCKTNFFTTDILVMEKTKDTKGHYFGVHTLVGENGTFTPKFLAKAGMY